MSKVFQIRPASLSKADNIRLLTLFDSQLTWLATIGSGEQWGDTLFSDQLACRKKYDEKVQRSEAGAQQPWTPDSVKVYFAEMTVDLAEANDGVRRLSRPVQDRMFPLPVGAMILEGRYAEHDYAHGILPEQDDEDPFIFISSLISDRRPYPTNKGVGAVLLDQAIKDAKELGMSRVCLDCWRGNRGKLVRYYERHGFKVIGEVGDLSVEQGAGNWPGAVMELRLKSDPHARVD